MLIELGNRAATQPGLDDRPKVTTIHIPDADEHGLGGYTHEPGLSVADFRNHRAEAMDFRNGITNLPEHEALLSIVAAWPTQSVEKPSWVNVVPTELTPDGVASDIQNFLAEHYGLDDVGRPGNVEDTHWTRYGPPGEALPYLPDLNNLLTNDGRVIANINDGGGKVGATGQASASSATTLTTGSTYTTNEWAGYRVYATVSATVMVWGNVVSNTNAASASVLTVDRWYAMATPGGTAGTTPSATATFAIADGGMVSAWFVGLATGANAPAATDHTLATNGNVEYATASGGYIRKIAPYAQTSGVATRALTLTPVFTGNGSDSYPQTFTTIGVFTGMVVGTAIIMKFETALNASATVAATGDQLTVTETINGS
jgi:hypothetical protein